MELLKARSELPLTIIADRFGDRWLLQALEQTAGDGPPRVDLEKAGARIVQLGAVRSRSDGSLPTSENLAHRAVRAFVQNDAEEAADVIDHIAQIIQHATWPFDISELASAMILVCDDIDRQKVAARWVTRPKRWFASWIETYGNGVFEFLPHLDVGKKTERVGVDLVMRALRAFGTEDAFRLACDWVPSESMYEFYEFALTEPLATSWLEKNGTAKAKRILQTLSGRSIASRPERPRSINVATRASREVDSAILALQIALDCRPLYGFIPHNLNDHFLTVEKFADRTDCDWVTSQDWSDYEICHPLTEQLAGSAAGRKLHAELDVNRHRYPFPVREIATHAYRPQSTIVERNPTWSVEFANASVRPYEDDRNPVVANAANAILSTLETSGSNRSTSPLPSWFSYDVVAKVCDIAGSDIEVEMVDRYVRRALQMKSELLEWSDDILMTIEMIERSFADEEEEEEEEDVELLSHRIDIESLGEFAHDAHKLSLAFDAEPEFAIDIVSLFGDERCYDALYEHAQSGSHLALDRILNSSDQTQLTRIIAAAHTLPFSSAELKRHFTRAAKNRGLNSFGLWLLNAPRYGLTTATIDVIYEHRTVTIDIANPIEPVYRNHNGRAVKSLPKPRPGDSSGELAYREAKQIQKGIEHHASQIIGWIDDTAGKSDRIPWQLFRQDVIHHPWLFGLARLVVWGLYDDYGLATAFRIDDERRIVDERDLDIEPKAFHFVGILSPRELSSSQIATWTEVLADYNIIQPFDQFSRRL